jgi:hypothetical protein
MALDVMATVEASRAEVAPVKAELAQVKGERDTARQTVTDLETRNMTLRDRVLEVELAHLRTTAQSVLESMVDTVSATAVQQRLEEVGYGDDDGRWTSYPTHESMCGCVWHQLTCKVEDLRPITPAPLPLVHLPGPLPGSQQYPRPNMAAFMQNQQGQGILSPTVQAPVRNHRVILIDSPGTVVSQAVWICGVGAQVNAPVVQREIVYAPYFMLSQSELARLNLRRDGSVDIRHLGRRY